jgi:6-pyruvoyltetrahydropterin/6-carboxytetrahydropterin synthase
MSGFELTRRYHFSAGHCLASPALSESDNERLYGQCCRPHGHNYEVEVTVGGALDPLTGMSADLGQLDAVVRRVLLDRVDHRDLSASVPELAGVLTTGEELARTFWRWLEAELSPGTLRRVAVVETANNHFEYAGGLRE